MLKMKCNLVQTTSADQLILQGLYFQSVSNHPSKTCILHIHGSYGNFYENFFLKNMFEEYPAKGFSFLSCGTRGRDYYADFKINNGDSYSSIRIGGILEKFQDCEIDIQAWVNFALSQGYNKIILQGHSLGAMKIAYYYSRTKSKIEGLIFLSPPDNFGLQHSLFGSRFNSDLEIARKLLLVDEKSLMPNESYFDPISAKSYLSLLDTENDTGMFTYSNIELMKRNGLDKITCPVLIIFATKNEAVTLSLDECIEALKNSLCNTANVVNEVLEGANHNYHFKEKELTERVVSWLLKTYSN
jgi:pimeloyl-ACP methyl ester carboxylesterase